MDVNNCNELVDSCGKNKFCDIKLNQCAPCTALCEDFYKSEVECQSLCPDFEWKGNNGTASAHNGVSINQPPQQDSVPQTTIIIILSVTLISIILVLILIVIVVLKRKKCTFRKEGFSEKKSTQSSDSRSVYDENAHNENHAINECYNVTNDESLNIHLEELSFPQQCSDDYSQPSYNIPRENHVDIAGIHEDLHQHTDSMLSTNTGSIKPPFKLKDNIRPLDRCEYVQDRTSSSMMVPTQSSTFPKIKAQSRDESHSVPAYNIHPRTPTHEKYSQHQNDPNRHNLQSKAENSPLMRDMATYTEVPHSVIDIQPPYLRNISLERQQSVSSPEPDEATENRAFLLPPPESQHMLLEVESSCLVMPYIIPYGNQQEPSPNRDADEPMTGTESENLDLRADSFRSETAEVADHRTDRSDVTTLADRRQRWEMVMRMNDAVNAKRLSFVAGCRMSDEALQVFVRPRPDLDLPACYRQILNAVPRDAPEHMLVVDVESTPII